MTGNGTVHFGPFEADLHAGEVRRGGERIKLQDQPFKVLQILLERPGDLVTREELQTRIWPKESFGDFDHAVNVAVGKLRSALGDSAENPAFIETVPRRGYRFVAKLDQPAPQRQVLIPPRVGMPLLAIAVVFGLGVALGSVMRTKSVVSFQRLTVQRGTLYSARFAPDGRNVLYAASWNGAPMEIYSTDITIPGARSLGLPGTDLLAVAPSGAVAVLQSTDPRFLLTVRGTLGEVSLGGGAPRQIVENVDWADFAPDMKTLAIVHEVAGKDRLEFPVGHVLYETTGWISHPRVSPQGDLIAFLDHESVPDDHGAVAIVDRAGHRTVLSRGWASAQGLAWSANGSEVWFTAAASGLQRRLYAVDLTGRHQRLVYQAPGSVTLQDIATNGRVLLTRDDHRAGMIALAPGATTERDVSWLDWSLPVGLSPDGNTLLFSEQSEQSGPNYTVAVRDLRNAAPISLGDGLAGDLSPDGKWATTVVASSQLLVLPTGAGSLKRPERGDIQSYLHGSHWLPDSKTIVFAATVPGHTARCFIQNIDSGPPRPITPEGVTSCEPSPDGKSIASDASIYPLDGSPPHAIPGLFPGETFEWTADPHFGYAFQIKPAPVTVYRLNVITGQRQAFREIRPPDATGLGCITHILFSADGRAYVYSYGRFLSDLYLVTGLQ